MIIGLRWRSLDRRHLKASFQEREYPNLFQPVQAVPGRKVGQGGAVLPAKVAVSLSALTD